MQFSDPSYFWFLIGILVLIIEIFTLSVVFLFVGLAAITLGAFLFFGAVDDSSRVAQAIIFFGSTIFWYLALYIPLKKIKIFKLKKGYKNILDQRAEVISEVTKEKPGKVKWSGTRMKAVLTINNINNSVNKGDIVRIVEIGENNILKVTNNSN